MTRAISQVDHDRLAFIHEALAAAQAVEVAEKLGVLARLVEAPADAATLAQNCAISIRGAAALLDALAGIGLVEVIGHGVYRICELPFPIAELRARWSRLETAVRTGMPVFSGSAVHEAEANYPRIVPMLAALFAPAAKRFAEQVVQPGMQVVDLGAGAAPWSIALARREPTCHVTAVDLPSVLAVTRQTVLAASCMAQFSFVEGDLFTTNWTASRYDLAIVGNLCHLFDGQTNVSLVDRVFGALRPLGRLAILDAVPNERGDGPRSVVLYALGLLMRTSMGRVYPFSTYTDWLRAAGYEAIECIDLSCAPPLTLVAGRRPS